MNRVWSKAFVVAGLVLMLGMGLSWGGPPNNDESDAGGNTASGSGALFSNTTGTANTASCSELITSAALLDYIPDFDWDYVRIARLSC